MRPSEDLHSIYEMPLLRKYPFIMLYNLKKTEQSPEHHPEGNVWNHTLLVVDEAAERKAESKNADVLMMAALLHDISKPECFTVDEKGIGHFYGHHIKSAQQAEKILRRLGYDDEFIEEVRILIRYHYIKEVTSSIKEKGIKKFIDSVGEEHLDDMFELMRADVMGKKNKDTEPVKKLKDLCNEYLHKKRCHPLREDGLKGK